MSIIETDVVVIGSGFGGAAPALRLAERGFRVHVIERGPRIDPMADFRQTQDPHYLLKYLKGLSGDRLSLTYAEGLGGGSGFYEMVSLRTPSQAFEQVDQSGHRLWPSGLDRAALDPYYDLAERTLRVEQIASEDVPKSGLVFARMMRTLGYSCERARYAVRNCIGSGFCVTGCIYGAKQSLLLNYLPQAVAAGATIETDLNVLRITTIGNASATRPHGHIGQAPLRYDVLCQRRGGGWVQFRARIVVLAAGTVGTAKLLLGSRSYLPALSAQIGRNVAFNGGVKVAGVLADHLPDGDMFVGRSHPGMISYEFLASHGISISAGKPLPVQAVSAARLVLDGDDPATDYWGQSHASLMKQYRRRMIILVAFGMTPPLGSIREKASSTFETHLDDTDDLRAYYKETKEILHGILTRNGCRVVEPHFVNREGRPHRQTHWATAHQVGSARMANDWRGGVANVDGEVFGYPGLYVSDGAAIPTSLAVNTSLTILANAERIAAGIADRYRAAR